MLNDKQIEENAITGSLAQAGMNILAYARPTNIEGQVAFAIHAADGTQLGLAPSRDIAHAVMVQNGLQPVALH